MLTQKLYKNGNSVAVTIPKEYLKDLDLRDGSVVVVEKRASEVVITSKRKKMVVEVDSKFARIVDEFITEHKDVLAKLAHK